MDTEPTRQNRNNAQPPLLFSKAMGAVHFLKDTGGKRDAFCLFHCALNVFCQSHCKLRREIQPPFPRLSACRPSEVGAGFRPQTQRLLCAASQTLCLAQAGEMFSFHGLLSTKEKPHCGIRLFVPKNAFHPKAGRRVYSFTPLPAFTLRKISYAKGPVRPIAWRRTLLPRIPMLNPTEL